MKDVMGLIFTGENDIHLGELTSLRAVAALPIAGRYRVVDFQLSSMVHSGIKNVGVITQKNYSSLMDHIGSGREWDLHGKQGLVVLSQSQIGVAYFLCRDIAVRVAYFLICTVYAHTYLVKHTVTFLRHEAATGQTPGFHVPDAFLHVQFAAEL